MRFYGREEELQVLKNFLLTVQKKKISQMVTVIGRRRVGKTTLILKAFEKAEIPVFTSLWSDKVPKKKSSLLGLT